MKDDTTRGSDGIITEMLKMGGKTMIRHLVKLFNKCLEQGNISEERSNALIIRAMLKT